MNGLVISLDTSQGIPLYEQIYMYIKEDIKKGNLVCGQRLPSSRKLAMYLEVSRSTVELAYEQLVSEGYVETIPCKGCYVTRIEDLYQWDDGGNRQKSVIHSGQIIEEAMENINLKAKEVELVPNNIKFDFSPNGIDLKSFPYNAWRKLAKNILIDDESKLFALGDSRGEYEFRSTICQYLHQARGMQCEPEQVVIGAGNEYLLMLLNTLIERCSVIAFENPTYERAYRVFENLYHKVVNIDMDKYGLCVDELEKSGAQIVYVMPSHQFPTGVVMPIKRRLELLRWASLSSKRYIIEDDYDSEFRYKGKPIPALQGYDTHDKVIYLGTFSKSIAPAIRMSYMVLPKGLVKVYNDKCKFLSTTVSKVDQMIVNQFIKEGYYERHLNKTRAMYKGRHDTLLQALKPLIVSGKCKVRGEHAGVHLLLEFQDGSKEEGRIQEAKEAAVKVYGMSKYYIKTVKDTKTTLLLGYANLSEEEILVASKILCQVWDVHEN